MKIISKEGLVTFSDDFGMRVLQNTHGEWELNVPPLLFNLIRARSLQTVEDLLSHLHTFPTSWRPVLGSGQDSWIEAMARLKVLLHGYVDDAHLNPPSPPPQFPYGAFPPGLDSSK